MNNPDKTDEENISLQVLGSEDGVIVASASGKANPLVVLDDDRCAELLSLWGKATAATAALPDDESTNAVRKLCVAVGDVVGKYTVARNKFFSGLHPLNEKEAVILELQRLSKELLALSKPQEPVFVCSFCGRDKHEVDRMVQGIDALICDKCLQTVQEMLNEK